MQILVKGRANALSETRKNIEAAKSLQIQPLHLYESESGVAGELHILVDAEVELSVVDVVEFAPNGKIISIQACLGKVENSAQ